MNLTMTDELKSIPFWIALSEWGKTGNVRNASSQLANAVSIVDNQSSREIDLFVVALLQEKRFS